MPSKHRHNISVTPDVWERWEQAAALAGAKRGMHMPVSEWLRIAAREKIENDWQGVLIERVDDFDEKKEEEL